MQTKSENRKNTIRLSYADIHNAGDLMNKDIVELISGNRTKISKTYNADMTAIGGALVGLQRTGGLRGAVKELIALPYRNKPVYIWGSGFWNDKNDRGLYRKNLKVCALRGELTKRKLEELTGKTYDVPLADAGLLVDMLLEPVTFLKRKRHNIGVIPHFYQLKDPSFTKLFESGDYHMIDIRRTPKEVAEDIVRCDTVISSSLHGLIFADSLHVPSLHVTGDTNLPDGNFKYEDYYSSYGLKDHPWDLRKSGIPLKSDIIRFSHVDYDKTDEKKKELLECFPKEWVRK